MLCPDTLAQVHALAAKLAKITGAPKPQFKEYTK